GRRVARARAAAERAGLPVPAPVATGLGNHELFEGRLDAAVRWYENSVAAAADEPGTRLLARATGVLARAYADDPTATDHAEALPPGTARARPTPPPTGPGLAGATSGPSSWPAAPVPPSSPAWPARRPRRSTPATATRTRRPGPSGARSTTGGPRGCGPRRARCCGRPPACSPGRGT